MKNIKKIAEWTVGILFMTFILYFFWSWGDVMAHNMTGTVNPYNLFHLLVQIAG